MDIIANFRGIGLGLLVSAATDAALIRTQLCNNKRRWKRLAVSDEEAGHAEHVELDTV